MPDVTHLRPMLVVNDMKETIGFWTEKLGFTVNASMAAADGQPPFWCLTRWAEVEEASREWRRYSSAHGTNIDDPVGGAELMMLNMDPPAHTKLRNLVRKAFTPRMVSALQPHIRDIAEQLIDRIAPMGRTSGSVLWKPVKIGDVTLTLTVPKHPDETLTDNNQLTAPIAILSSAVLSTSGVFFALWITRTEFNVSSFMGLIMVVGIVAKNGILLLDANQKFAHANFEPEEAMVQAGRRRLRPIFMTALATMAGMLPLAFALGAGSEMLQPLAIAVIGGILVSMVLSLIVTPAVYFYLGKRRAHS